MNKFILAFLLVVTSNILFGQTEKGKFIVGAGSNFALSHSSGLYDIKANLKGGYFLFKNFALGIEPSWFYNRSYLNGYLNRRSTFLILPFARYYVRANKFGIFAEAKGGPTISYYKYANKNDNIKYSRSYSDYSFGAGLGVNYFVNDRVALELNNTLYGLDGFNPSLISNLGFLILF